MNKKELEPVGVLGEIREFFSANFENFSEQEPSGMITFAREFYRHDLRIVVVTPVICLATKAKGLADGWLRIRFAVHRKSAEECFVLKNTVFTGDWGKMAKEKIDLLTKLIEAAPQCPMCNATTYPKQGKGLQMQYVCSQHEGHECWGMPFDAELERRFRKLVVKKY